jgi:hypothetical protein
MKYHILFLFLVCTVAVQAQQKQSLKDLLYSGKLKRDSSGIIRSTDDLSSKIDTSTQKKPEPEKAKIVTVTSDSVKKVFAPKTDSVATVSITPTENNVPVRTNTKIWKDYIDSLARNLKSEVLTSKKIKKDTYYLTLDYEIGIDGQVNVLNITSTPENSFLQAQIRQMLDSNPPRLIPVVDSANQPRKVKRKQNFNITKE